MIDWHYPWRWLSDGVGGTFVLRYPWIESIRDAAERTQSVCLLVPEAAGPLSEWGDWLAERIDTEGSTRCRLASGDFREVSQELADALGVGDGSFAIRPADWSRRFLAECRREIPHIDTTPLVVVDADDHCAAALQDLVEAQRDLGYLCVRPVLIRRDPPPDWDGDIIRFGLPEWVGDLNRIEPPPARDLDFWTNLFLALTVAWEAGAVPRLADELWDVLRLQRTISLRDGGFDAWLERELNGFAKRNRTAFEAPLPQSFAFGPSLALGSDELWHSGAVAWEGEAFDVTPLRARLWAAELSPDAKASLLRRRLTNVPLARWLSAWAASIEESLRVAVLRAGSESFRRYLEAQSPRQHRNVYYRSRLDELGSEEGGGIVDSADFGDLAQFLARSPTRSSLQNPARLLDQCRMARNRVVHQRLVSSSDLLCIANTVAFVEEYLN